MFDTQISRTRLRAASAVLALAWASLAVPADTAWAEAVGLQQLASGLNRPVYATHAPGDSERLFVLEKNGTIRILDLATGAVNSTPFLTIADTDSNQPEEGLLGLAFHPDYQTNGKFYVNVTVNDGGAGVATRTHIREYTVSSNPDVANASSVRSLLTINQPQSNHNGGWMGFSPNDGYLYIATGDGGGSDDNDPGHTTGTGNAQDITNNLLGKMLRIDVDGSNGPGGAYGIPAANPFVGVSGDDEIWAYGLRNPWRNSFDRVTGDLWIGDVGQNVYEEINFQPAASTGGENYGWRLREGLHPTPSGGVGGNRPAGNVDPVYEYTHGGGTLQGASTVGGYLYRGPDPELQGTYFFADSVSSNIWTFDPASPNTTVERINSDIPPNRGSLNAIVSFAEDAYGNLYLINIGNSLFSPSANTGAIYRLVTDALIPGDFNGDGQVDSADLAEWEDGFGLTGGAGVSDGDANGDGMVTGADFLIWQQNVGNTAQQTVAPAAAAAEQIPEPAAIGLILLALAASLAVRRTQ